ncbi:hypothetical protein CPLU01_07504 [Colletotrichum plurivorum]|uniref:Uncharacterized protein n=1 Tax=Colletotrichum plurivorum TaxID=2175906 RepID=A0A8H6NF16_9PEZI|nr:hypothetical protein CPLU01_07504 [Colletotrichum plurivorum]
MSEGVALPLPLPPPPPLLLAASASASAHALAASCNATLSDLGRRPSVPGRAKVNPATDRDDLLLLTPEPLELRETRSDVDVDISTNRWLNLASRNGLVRGGPAVAQGESPALDGYYSGGASNSSTGQDKAPPPPKARRSESKGQPPALGSWTRRRPSCRSEEIQKPPESSLQQRRRHPASDSQPNRQEVARRPARDGAFSLATSVCSSFAVAEGALEGGGNGMAWHCLQEGEEMCPRNLADSTSSTPVPEAVLSWTAFVLSAFVLFLDTNLRPRLVEAGLPAPSTEGEALTMKAKHPKDRSRPRLQR